MITRGDKDITRGLAFNGDFGTTGQVPVSAGGATNTWADISALLTLVSADADNDIAAGSDGGAFLQETEETFTFNPATNIITFTGASGVAQDVDISALAPDVKLDGATLDPASLLLTMTLDDAGTATDVTVSLASLRGSLVDNADGTYTFDDGSGTTVTIETRDGVSSDTGNQLTVGADGRPFFAAAAETVTSITGMDAANPASVVYTDEAAADTTVTFVSADADNAISAGTDGKLFATKGAGKVALPFVVGDWTGPAGGLYSLSFTAADIAAAGGVADAGAMLSVTEGGELLGLQTARVEADGAITLEVPELPDDRFAGSAIYVYDIA